uniref:Kinesin motor domain-containing protein n=1 Tax=Ananas comosus var. bracteatus TaxID=296719 RepID=A0A6V7PHH0_ANACO|nr:unnamed protein product [Ananas comosus var. bracteatus]
MGLIRGFDGRGELVGHLHPFDFRLPTLSLLLIKVGESQENLKNYGALNVRIRRLQAMISHGTTFRTAARKATPPSPFAPSCPTPKSTPRKGRGTSQALVLKLSCKLQQAAFPPHHLTNSTVPSPFPTPHPTSHIYSSLSISLGFPVILRSIRPPLSLSRYGGGGGGGGGGGEKAAMASGSYRNGGGGGGAAPRLSAKLDRQNSGAHATPKASSKSRPPATPGAAAGGFRRSSSGPLTSTAAGRGDAGVPGRVRVAVRLRPRNGEESVADADFGDCVELQPELKRLKLRKNNWESETYEFDEVLTEFASQKRVYEVVAKPVVESVLEGYNGTVMAYGQTGTGKTFTLGRLGEEDTAARGIMVRAMEDILADISPETDSVSVSYLQLYMETIQDLLDPVNDNIAIIEDPKTGDVSLPGATIVEIRDQKSFVDLLTLGEAHRFAANTKLNTESSRSHAILMVQVRRAVKGRHDTELNFHGENGHTSPLCHLLDRQLSGKASLLLLTSQDQSE